MIEILNIPNPCKNEVEKWLNESKKNESFQEIEKSLKKLFNKDKKQMNGNEDIESILIKVASLNFFYSTNLNVTEVGVMSRHIHNLNIDNQLTWDNEDLVDKIAKNEGERKHYSFATKYSSFHKPDYYPIYDSYVSKLLCYFNEQHNFYKDKENALSDGNFAKWDIHLREKYLNFKNVFLSFVEKFELTGYSTKEIDVYLWQLGRQYYGPVYFDQKKRGEVWNAKFGKNNEGEISGHDVHKNKYDKKEKFGWKIKHIISRQDGGSDDVSNLEIILNPEVTKN